MARLVRGMRDVLPDEARRWRSVEQAIVGVLDGFAYEEMHLPLLEDTELFSRGIGAATDIVEQEMFSLEDRDGNSLSLRPEGTASCARALLQHGLLHNRQQRVFYRGPMFRYERPQKGRFRQFYQVGVEAFGLPGPDVDVELIQLGTEIWRRLGIDDQIRLELNTLGSKAARTAWRDSLVAYLQPRRSDLDADSARRLDRNPLRILDSKAEATRAILADAPKFQDYIDEESAEHYDSLKEMLNALGIAYVENALLVRGLDYYGKTVFEWTTDCLGAQGAVCGGGRYDGLVEIVGGKPTPGAGFALGLERVLLLHESVHEAVATAAADAYCCIPNRAQQAEALAIVQRLRESVPGVRFRVHVGGGKLKNQLRNADQSGARWALLLGEDELRDGRIALKELRNRAPQQTLGVEAIVEYLRNCKMRQVNSMGASGG